MLVISPHMDDGVLSCGQALTGRAGTVLTVFAGVPPEAIGVPTRYDEQSGFVSPALAVAARRREDRDACSVIGARAHHCDWLDRQYRPDYADGPTTIEVAAMIAERLHTPLSGPVLAPLGIAHPDHLLVAAAARMAALEAPAPRPLIVYEELPYRALDPTLAIAELERLSSRWSIERVEWTSGPLAVKHAAVHCYRSQLWNLNVHACLIPERFWKLTPR